jgi:glutathione S-transferase-like protein
MARLSLDNAAGPQLAADRWTAYSLTVWAICMLGFAFDIYEGTIMQLVTPILIKEWGIVPATMGYITTLSAWVGLIGVSLSGAGRSLRPPAYSHSDNPLARARTYQWLGEAASDMAPTAQNIFFLGNRMPEKVPESAIKFYEDRLVTQFRTADEQLARTPYLTGSEITVADLGLYPIYAGRKALIDGAGLKNVTAWGERVGARPGVQKGMKLES